MKPFLSLLLSVMILFGSSAQALSFYFTNTGLSTGDVSQVNNWSMDAGGTTPASTLPGASDDVFFNSTSQIPKLGGPLTVRSATFTGGAFNAISITSSSTSTIDNGYNDKGLLGLPNTYSDALVSNTPDDAPDDADVTDFITRANITDPAVINQYKRFTRLMKVHAPTLWSRLVIVPARSHQGYLYPFGGGVLSLPTGTNPFQEVGTVTESTSGASIAYSGGFPNAIQTPASFNYDTNRALLEPMFMGVVASNTPTSGIFSDGYQILATPSNAAYMSSYFCSQSNYGIASCYVGGAVQGASSGQYLAYGTNIFDSRVPFLAGNELTNGALSVTNMVNSLIQTKTHASATVNTSSSDGFKFFPHLSGAGAVGEIQFIVMAIGGISDIPEEAKKLWPILNVTLLDDHDANPIHLEISQSGQSNSVGVTPVERIRLFNTQYKISNYQIASGIGGQYFSHWVGADANNPVRSAGYTSNFYPETLNVFTNTQLGKKVHKIVDWIQGESDTQTLQEALDYKKRLTSFYNFIKADFGSDVKMAIAGIDYSIGNRTSTSIGNFILSGLTGTSLGANGTYVITAVAPVLDGLDAGHISNADTPYSWTKGGYSISKNVYQWEIKDGSTVIARSYGNPVDHPQLATGWVVLSGGGTPVVDTSRTGQIEIVRKAQRDFVMEHPTDTFFYDSRGAARKDDNPAALTYLGASDYLAIDGVHMNKDGFIYLAKKFTQAMDDALGVTSVSNTSNIVGNLKLTGNSYNAGTITGNLQLGEIDGTSLTTINNNYGTVTGQLTVYAEIDPATGLSVIGSTDDPEDQVPRSAVTNLGSYGTLNVVGPLANDNITGATAKAANITTPTQIIIAGAPTTALNGTYTLVVPGIYTNGSRYINFTGGIVRFYLIQSAAENAVGNTVSQPTVGAGITLVALDTTAPVISAGAPTTQQAAGTTSVTLQVTTDDNSTCKYSTVPNTSYAAMTDTFTTTGATNHSKILTGLTNGSTYNYYIRCSNADSTINTTDYLISFSVASGSGGGGGGVITPTTGNQFCTGVLPSGATVLQTGSSTQNYPWRYDSSPTGPYFLCSFKCANNGIYNAANNTCTSIPSINISVLNVPGHQLSGSPSVPPKVLPVFPGYLIPTGKRAFWEPWKATNTVFNSAPEEGNMINTLLSTKSTTGVNNTGFYYPSENANIVSDLQSRHAGAQITKDTYMNQCVTKAGKSYYRKCSLGFDFTEANLFRDDVVCEGFIAFQVQENAYRMQDMMTRKEAIDTAVKMKKIGGEQVLISEQQNTTNTNLILETAFKHNIIAKTRASLELDRSVTRAEAYAMVMNSVCMVSPSGVNGTKWQKNIYDVANRNGLTSKAWNIFEPDRAILRQEFFTIASRASDWAERTGGCDPKPKWCFLPVEEPIANVSALKDPQSVPTVAPFTVNIAYNRKNDPKDVRKLQQFLNDYMGESLVLTGRFDYLTREAVKRFQLKFREELLTSQGIKTPTGEVGNATREKINSLLK